MSSFNLSQFISSEQSVTDASGVGLDLASELANLPSVDLETVDITIQVDLPLASVVSWFSFNEDGTFSSLMPDASYGVTLASAQVRQIDGQSASAALADVYIEKVVADVYATRTEDESVLRYFCGLSKPRITSEFNALKIFNDILPKIGNDADHDMHLTTPTPQIVYQLLALDRSGVSPGSPLPIQAGDRIYCKPFHVKDSAAGRGGVDVKVMIQINCV